MSTLADLKKLTAGLLYPSDSDAPFAVEPLAAITFDEFLEDLADNPDWRVFRAGVEKLLSNVQITRAGDVDVEYRITGIDKDGELYCLKTTSVET